MRTFFKSREAKPSKVNCSMFNFSKMKVSKQIFTTFSIVITLSFILLIVNLWSANRITKANQQLIQAYSYRFIATKMTNVSIKGQSQTHLMSRIVQDEKRIELQDDIIIATIVSELETTINEVELVLKDLAPDKMEEFKGLVNEVIDNCNAWQNSKGAATLIAIDGTLMKFKLFTTDLATDLNILIDTRVTATEGQVKIARAINLLLNLLIPVFLLIVILPLLSNLKKLFSPVRQAADSAVQSATNAFEYAAQINESISELKHVLMEVSHSIGEVSVGAQDSSNQAEKIIGSIQITSDLVAELGEIANTVYKNLDANQSNLQEKITQVKQLSENVSQSLAMINQNADIAAKLATQVNNLEA